MTLSIYFLLCSANQITAEQKNSSVTQKFYNQTDKKKLLKENINLWCQWAWERDFWIHSKNLQWSQLSTSSESQSTFIYWSEYFKITQIWYHDLSHAEWS